MKSDIGIIINTIMRDRKVNQTELAKLLNRTQPEISRFLSGERNMSDDELEAIGKYLNTSVIDYYLKGKMLNAWLKSMGGLFSETKKGKFNAVEKVKR